MEHERDKPRFDTMMMTSIISLLRVARVFPTGLVLIGLAVVEVLVESLVGKVVGQVYQIYVDKDKEQFQGVPSKVVAQPPAEGVPMGMGSGIPVTALATPRAAGAEDEHLLSAVGPGHNRNTALLHGRLDNPDQRMTQDVVQFCEKFEQFLRKTAKSPFNLIVYTYLTVNLFKSFLPVLCAVAYFCLFALLQKAVMSTMATAINTYQQCEGDLRAAHMRVRVDAVPIASWGGSAVEERNVNTSLYLTLSAQTSMAWTFILQNTLAKAGDYYAVAVNYGIIGVAVFIGSFTQDSETGGAAASEISQASFYLILLMNSLTSILDATKELGEVAGHTARIHNFLKQMESISPDKGQGGASHKASPFSPRTSSQPGAAGRDGHTLLRPSTHVVDVDSPGSQSRPMRRVLSDTLNRRRPPSEELDVWHSNDAESVFGGTLPEYLKDQASTLLPPTSGLLPDGSVMEFSVHKLGTDELGEIVGNVFPDVPSGSPLLAVCTFQTVPSLGTVVLRPAQAKEKQMAGLLKRYLSWEGSVRANLQAHGFWCDSVHPQTGFALYSTQGAKYSEAIGAQVFLQYQVRNESGLGIIVHPTYGTKVYPVTFFTTAPYVSLLAAMTKACTLERNEQSTQWQYAALDRPDFPLLAVFDVTIADGNMEGEPGAFARCSARNLSFEVQRGQHTVIYGSPGIGKSTLLSAIRGLTKIHQGVIKWCPGVRAMLVPQLSVVAPDATLSAQVSYPSLQLCSHEDAVQALLAVGLGYLVERFEKGAASEDFFNLSKGELQCMGIARVLQAKPDLAMLDEALSAVPVHTELRLLDLLAQAGITMLIVSHRDQVRQIASSILTLDATLADGWTLDHVH